MTTFKAFAHTAQSTKIASPSPTKGLSIVSDDSKIIFYGDLEIRKDQAGLDSARRLRDILNDTVAELEKEELPAVAPAADADAIQKKENPFG